MQSIGKPNAEGGKPRTARRTQRWIATQMPKRRARPAGFHAPGRVISSGRSLYRSSNARATLACFVLCYRNRASVASANPMRLRESMTRNFTDAHPPRLVIEHATSARSGRLHIVPQVVYTLEVPRGVQ